MLPGETRPLRQLGPYRILRRLGAGGMAEVHLARRFGASGWEATLELISIGDGVVEGRLCNVDIGPAILMPALDGLFTADLCP